MPKFNINATSIGAVGDHTTINYHNGAGQVPTADADKSMAIAAEIDHFHQAAAAAAVTDEQRQDVQAIAEAKEHAKSGNMAAFRACLGKVSTWGLGFGRDLALK